MVQQAPVLPRAGVMARSPIDGLREIRTSLSQSLANIETTLVLLFPQWMPRENLVGEWLIYEGSGATIHDSSGRDNHGTLYGPQWKLIPSGKWIIDFDGVNDRAELPMPNFTEDITLILWVYVIGPGVAPYMVGCPIFRSFYKRSFFILGVIKEYNPMLSIRNSVGDMIYYSRRLNLPPKQWNHIGISYDYRGNKLWYSLNGHIRDLGVLKNVPFDLGGGTALMGASFGGYLTYSAAEVRLYDKSLPDLIKYHFEATRSIYGV